nr:helix-turn-helix transcriptional regulator [Streptococcus ovuberis]
MIKLRKERGLSQEDLAEKLYVSRQTISNWERGKTYPDINSLLLMATYFDVSLDNLIKGDIEKMRFHNDKKQFKKWLVISGLSWFAYSVAYPTRFLMTVNQSNTLLSLIAIPLIYAVFQLFYIYKNHDFRPYADILNFLDDKKKHVTNTSDDIWFLIGLGFSIWLIFFAGTVVSTLLFW